MKKIIIIILSTGFLLITGSAHAKNNSLNSKENKISCTQIKTKYQSSIISDWSNGLATDKDVIKEVESNIKMLSAKAVYTNGKLKLHINSWIDAEKKTRVSLINSDIDGISAAMTLKISSVNKLDKLCKSIGR
jgi:hypothetical protein